MWVTKIDVRENSVVLDLFTDAYSDVRYRTSLTFPFPKGSLPAAEDVEKLVGEVLKVQPAGDAKTDVQPQAHAAAQQAEPAVPAPAAEAPPPPIAPPPPPPADPKNISQGQTTDQVIASLGPPSKKVTLGVKQVYYYPDMKVIFVNGKVSDVQ
jgi:hypothetical protein